MELAQRFVDGLAALRAGEADRAATLLAEVCADPDLATAPDLRDFYARACSMRAQALLLAGRPAEARRPLRDALDVLATLGDDAALAEVTALQAQIGEAMSQDFQAMARRREQRAAAARPLAEALAAASGPAAQADAAIKWSGGALADGRPAEAADAARVAAEIAAAAGDVRHEVLARIAWSHADPSAAVAQLELARARADAADEFNLVGAVARAAEQLDVTLAPPPPPEAR